ncbi:MAG: glycosyltransferase family 9 protein [Deltaproteobacteria bacterium]|nr:glycosyltransferase family 9 protein [Deltaproteobacteria bacterium]
MIYVILAYIFYPLIVLLTRFKKRRMDSVLVFQTAKIGDMICTTPVFREIKKAHPGIRLGVVADPVTKPLLEHNPHIDEVIVLDRKKTKGLTGKLSFARYVRSLDYSSALILMPNVTNLFVAFWARIPDRFSVYPDFAGRTLKYLLALSTDVEYHYSPRMSMETYLRSLRHFDIINWELDKEVYPSPEAQSKVSNILRGDGPFVGVVLGTGNEMKDWGKDNFLMLVRLILERTDCEVVLLGSEKEGPVANAVIDYAGSDRIQNLCGLLTLTEMPALIKKLKLAVGVDTGLIYMADALNVPVVVVAGPCDMNDQRPTGKQSFIVQDRELQCVPCSHTFSTPYECRHKHRGCVTEIAAEGVFKRVLQALEAGR